MVPRALLRCVIEPTCLLRQALRGIRLLQDVFARDAETFSLRASVVFIKDVGLSQLAVDTNRLFPNLDADV